MIDPLLKIRLQRVVKRQRRLQLWCKLAVCWSGAALLGFGLILLQRRIGWASSLALPLMAVVGVGAAIIVAVRHRRTNPDWPRIATEVEAQHPELDGRLLTAMQQEIEPGEAFNYLQERLVQEVVRHSEQNKWGGIVPRSRIATAQAAHLLALVLFGFVLYGLRTTGGQALLARISETGITVTPGDVSLERGSSLVVLARFGGTLPATVDLVIADAPEGSRRISLTRSLADPMFGGSVPEVSSNLVYHVEYAGQRTRDFKVSVFEFPRLERSDMDLTFPEYTGQAAKHIKDTRRLSAVEGSHLDLSLQLNKPVASARLVAKDNEKTTIQLLVGPSRAVAELKQFTLAASKTYELQLVDAENRTNKLPAQFVFDVLKNRAPELKLASPRGDVRPSALEEISFEGTVWDDFGVRAYGLAYTVAGQEPKLIELGRGVTAKDKRSFQHLLRLEDLGVQPDGLVSWFVWAEDIDANGQVRHTSGDLFFAEVRPFDEIFREGQGGESGQSGEPGGGESGGQAAKLAELQKQIINATWKLQREHGDKPGGSGKPSPARDFPAKPAGKQGAQNRIPVPPGTSITSSVTTQASSLFSVEPIWQGETWSWKLVSTLALIPALSPGEREDPARATDASVSRLPAPRLLLLLAQPQADLNRSHCLKLADDSPSPGGEGRGEGGPRYHLPGGETLGSRLAPMNTAGNHRHWRNIVAGQFFGQRSESESTPRILPRTTRGAGEKSPPPGKTPSYEEDLTVVRDAVNQALEQAEAGKERQEDPKAAALWNEVIAELERSQSQLDKALTTPALLAAALAAEQTAYQALLKLQQREYSVNRNRNRNQSGGGGRQQQMQRQLEQMDLTHSEDRYETQRQAQAPQNQERREELQVMNRLQELARRQQDLNDRLKELQTALQEARTEAEREEIRRQLKRLQEEEQQMLADVDEVRQRMERPENQSRMADERRQLEQTRNDMQRTAEAASQGAASQALASGTRAQRQLQELRDQMRKENSSQFSEDLREMRTEARDLARQQEDMLNQMQTEARSGRKSLSDSGERKELTDRLARQKERMTNLVDRATQVSQDAEGAEPLLSRQLYDTVRKFSQDSGKGVKDVQDELIGQGLMTRGLYEKLNEAAEPDGAKLMDATSELVRQDFLPQARKAGQRVRTNLDDLKRGVERAAESVLGDDTEALRLAQQELNQLTDQLQREIAQAQAGNGGTNQSPSETAESSGGQSANASPNGQGQPSQMREPGQRSGQPAQAGEQNQPGSERPEGREPSSSPGTPGQSPSEQAASAPGGEQPGDAPQPGGGGQAGQPGDAQRRSGQPAQTAQAGRGGRSPRDAARDGRPDNAGGGGNGGSYRGGARFDFDRILNRDPALLSGPITGENFVPWSDRLRDVEEMIDVPELRNDVAAARERARLLRQEFKRDLKKPDWAVVRLQVIKPLVEVRDRIAEELARRQSTDSFVPIDRDPVPSRYSELVRRYYEELGKDK